MTRKSIVLKFLFLFMLSGILLKAHGQDGVDAKLVSHITSAFLSPANYSQI